MGKESVLEQHTESVVSVLAGITIISDLLERIRDLLIIAYLFPFLIFFVVMEHCLIGLIEARALTTPHQLLFKTLDTHCQALAGMKRCLENR